MVESKEQNELNLNIAGQLYSLNNSDLTDISYIVL